MSCVNRVFHAKSIVNGQPTPHPFTPIEKNRGFVFLICPNGDGRAVGVTDWDGDGDLDAFVANRWSTVFAGDTNSVWLNDGAGKFEDSGQNLGDSSSVELGDVDGDGDLDLAFANEDEANLKKALEHDQVSASADEMLELE